MNSVDYAVLGGSSKIAAIILTYPFQVIRSRLQQRPSMEGIPRYMDSWHVMKATARFEGFRGFYKGITPNLLKNVPASSITFIVYENVLKLLKLGRTSDWDFSCLYFLHSFSRIFDNAIKEKNWHKRRCNELLQKKITGKILSKFEEVVSPFFPKHANYTVTNHSCRHSFHVKPLLEPC